MHKPFVNPGFQTTKPREIKKKKLGGREEGCDHVP